LVGIPTAVTTFQDPALNGLYFAVNGPNSPKRRGLITFVPWNIAPIFERSDGAHHDLVGQVHRCASLDMGAVP
jgi:hypothetical protein